MNWIAIFLGGGLGSLCRYGFARLLSNYQHIFPFGTLVANALSCIILGFTASLVYQNDALLSPSAKLFILVGFCGGFSTYSTFTNETFSLLQNGNWTTAFFNIFGNLFLCLFCIFLGMQLTKTFFSS